MSTAETMGGVSNSVDGKDQLCVRWDGGPGGVVDEVRFFFGVSDAMTAAKELSQFMHMGGVHDSSVFLKKQKTLQIVRQGRSRCVVHWTLCEAMFLTFDDGSFEKGEIF